MNIYPKKSTIKKLIFPTWLIFSTSSYFSTDCRSSIQDLYYPTSTFNIFLNFQIFPKAVLKSWSNWSSKNRSWNQIFGNRFFHNFVVLRVAEGCFSSSILDRLFCYLRQVAVRGGIKNFCFRSSFESRCNSISMRLQLPFLHLINVHFPSIHPSLNSLSTIPFFLVLPSAYSSSASKFMRNHPLIRHYEIVWIVPGVIILCNVWRHREWREKTVLCAVHVLVGASNCLFPLLLMRNPSISLCTRAFKLKRPRKSRDLRAS